MIKVFSQKGSEIVQSREQASARFEGPRRPPREFFSGSLVWYNLFRHEWMA